MIFADKLIALRKKNGWSQEELAEQMNVTRQSVSKWESVQSVPDLEKILKLSELFGVSTDYLLRDEIESVEIGENIPEISPVRRVSMEEANDFLKIKNETAIQIACATFMCIISPIVLLMLGAASSVGMISENVSGAIGIAFLLLLVLGAVAIFIYCGSKTSIYEFLEKETFETEYGVTGMVKERQKHYRQTYTYSNLVGTCLCIFSVIPLLVSSFLTQNELIIIGAVCFILLIAGIGCMFFITSGIKWESMQKLLQEGDYTCEKKKMNTLLSPIYVVYWLSATAIYLAWSFATDEWDRTWIIWPVAGVLFAAVAVITSSFKKNK